MSGVSLRNGWKLPKVVDSYHVRFLFVWLLNDKVKLVLRRASTGFSYPECAQSRLHQAPSQEWSYSTRMESNWQLATCALRYVPPSRGSIIITDFAENIPTAVFLFDFPSPRETTIPRLRTVLLHSQSVLHARWNPVRKGSLCLCCGIQSVYIWSDEWQGEGGEEEEMAECIGVPASQSFASPFRS